MSAFPSLAGASIVLAAVALPSCASASRDEPRRAGADGSSGDRFVYVGTYTSPGIPPDGKRPSTARGIYVFRMRAADGHLTPVQTMPTENPSFLALDPSMTHLYCTNENESSVGAPAGRVTAFGIDASSGTLALLNTRPTNGNDPAHLSVHPSGRYLMGSNYNDGDYPIYRILADGSIGPETDDVHGSGKGPNADRQEGPHAHQIVTDPEGRHVFGVDLGADKIFSWDLDLATGKLTPNGPGPLAIPPGSGPRHMVFHPSGRFAYVVSEMAGTITTLHYDSTRGSLLLGESVSTLPPGYTGPKSGAEIRIHPGGRFVYATNCGHDSVAIFAIDQGTGALTAIGWEPTQGESPRGMNIDPSGAFLYAANQNSDTIVIFRIDSSSGKLTPTGEIVHTPTPVDIEFGARL
jgi:6-phosphogluconolactonase